MKKASLFISFGIFALSVSVSASELVQAQLSKTFAFPVESLEKVEAALQTAHSRTGSAKSVDATYVIDANENSSVRCAGGLPEVLDGALYGCTLDFAVDIGGGATITARKMLLIQQSSQEIRTLLSKTDPNQTSRIDLNAPFDGGNGSTYYCNAEGSTGAKAWACYLAVVD